VGAKTTQRNLALLIFALTIALGLVWYFYLYSPALAAAEERRTEIAALDIEKQQGLAARRNIAGLCAEVAELKVKRAELLAALPPEERLANLLDQLRGSVIQGGSTLNSVTRSRAAGASTLPEGVKTVEIGMGTEGSFGSFYRTLRAIESLQRFSRVNTISLSLRGEPESLDPELVVQAAMTSFIYDPAGGRDNAAEAEVASCNNLPGVGQ
jgi:type IV pilus assembly protein PilO